MVRFTSREEAKDQSDSKALNTLRSIVSVSMQRLPLVAKILKFLFKRTLGAYRNEKTIRCIQPFYNMEIYTDGRALTCISTIMKQPIGNINQAGILETFNSIEAKAVRASIYDGTYDYCCETCPVFNEDRFHQIDSDFIDTWEFLRPDQRRAIQSKSLHVPLGPSKIADNVNVACPIGCEFCFLTVEKMNNGTAAKMTNFVTSNLRNLKLVHFCGGEPFLQKTTRRILREASQVDDPPKFEFVTSLSYLDDDLRQRITASKLHYVNVSVNAATRMTYQKTIARGNWERLIENLDFIEGARGSGQLMMSFVVTRSNFHEIEQFAHFCQRWSPASIHYHTLKPGTENYEDLQLNREQAKSVLDQLKAPIFTQLGHKAHVVVLRDMCRAIAGQAAAA